MISGLPRLAVAALKLAVTAGLLWLILHSVGAEAIVRAFSRIDPLLLVPAVVMLLLQFAVMAWRWQVLLQVLFEKVVALRTLALSIGQGMLASQALPATVGGDAYRMALVANRVGAGAAVRSVICDRVLALVILIALVVALSPALIWRFGADAAVLSVIAASVAALCAFAVTVYLGPAAASLPVVGATLSTLATDARHALFGGSQAWLASGLGLATHLLGVMLIYFLAIAVATPLPALDCLLIVPPILLVSALPISLGGWGVREGVFFAGFSMAGADPAGGVTVSILFGASGILLGAICGALAPLVAEPVAGQEKS